MGAESAGLMGAVRNPELDLSGRTVVTAVVRDGKPLLAGQASQSYSAWMG